MIIFMSGQKFTIGKILAFPDPDAVMILGYAFWKGQKQNRPFVPDDTYVSFVGTKFTILETLKLKFKFVFYIVEISKIYGSTPCELAYRVRSKCSKLQVDELFKRQNNISWDDDFCYLHGRIERPIL